MTPEELRSYVYNITLLEDTAGNDAIINSYLEQGYYDICSAFDWQWMISATPADIAVSDSILAADLPTGFFKAISLWEPDRAIQLKPMSPSAAIAMYAGAGVSGTPMVYYIADGQIVVKPIPDTAYTLKLDYYKFTPVDFTLTTAPPFEPAFHRAIAEFAIGKVWEQEEDFDRAEIYFGLFRDTLARMYSFYGDQTGGYPMIYGEPRTRVARIPNTLANMPFGVDGLI